MNVPALFSYRIYTMSGSPQSTWIDLEANSPLCGVIFIPIEEVAHNKSNLLHR